MPTRRAVGVAEANGLDARPTEAVPAARRLVGLAQHQVADGALALDSFRRRLDKVAVVASLPVGSLSASLWLRLLGSRSRKDGKYVWRRCHVDSATSIQQNKAIHAAKQGNTQ